MAKPTTTTGGSRFLELPIELRIMIYSFAIEDEANVTVGYDRSCHPHERFSPVIRGQYDKNLLLHPTPPPPPPSTTTAPLTEDINTAHRSLLTTNLQIRHELSQHFNAPQPRSFHLFIQYPHGLHIFSQLQPSLMQRAKTVHMAGGFTPRPEGLSFRAPHVLPHRSTISSAGGGSDDENLHQQRGDSRWEMETFLKHHFAELEMLELRIYYPGTYSGVWTDDDSVIAVVLRSVGAARIALEVWRGNDGTGVLLRARASPDGEREVVTTWRRFEEEGQSGKADGHVEWIVDPRWPLWETVREAAEESCDSVVRGGVGNTEEIRA